MTAIANVCGRINGDMNIESKQIRWRNRRSHYKWQFFSNFL